MLQSPIMFRVSYINNLPSPVTVGLRSGLKFTLPPQPSFTCDKLLIRIVIDINHPTVRNDIQRLLSVVTNDGSPELKALREGLRLEVEQNHHGGATIVMDYPLSYDRLREMGGVVYYHEIDTIFSLSNVDSCPPHPFSEEGRNLQLIDTNACGNTGAFGYSIEMIDNCGKYGERYISIAKKVYRITPTKDVTRRDGIYIVSNYPIEREWGTDEREVRHHSFENAEDELGIFRTAEEALTLGDIATARKQEILSLEHSLNLQKVEIQNLKQTHERELHQLEREKKLLEMDAEKHTRLVEELRQQSEHQLKMERERVKDYYESRSYERKDSNETLKFLPAIVVGLGAVFMALKPLLGGK